MSKEEIYFDGGSRGNGSANAIAGWAFVSPADNIAGSGYSMGSTNNEMEYTALIEAMNFALLNGKTNVVFYGDSKLVVEQFNGNWKCKAANLIPLLEEARSISSEFFRIEVAWIPREKNFADEYYNRELDRLN